MTSSANDCTTVLTGAGISMDAPSVLPSGEELRDLAWEALTRTLPTRIQPYAVEARNELRRRVLDDWNGMRLEQMLAVLAGFTSVDALVPIYDVLQGAKPNSTHEALVARSFSSVLTTNMDRLLEDAGARAVVHLHGDWEHPAEIRTTIEQYLEGLSDEAEQQFRDAVAGKRVLVVGYSGRDRDVVRAFSVHRPEKIVWVSHTTNLDPSTHVLSEELREFHDALRRAGVSIDVVFAPTLEFLLGHPPTSSAPASASSARNWGVPPSAIQALRHVHLDKRVLGLSAVLLELGMNLRARDLLADHRFTSRFAVQGRKQRGRMWRRLDHPLRAILQLARPPINPAALRDYAGNISEFAAAVSQSGWRQTADVLDTFIVSAASRRSSAPTAMELRARARRGERSAVRGALTAAMRDLDYLADGSERLVGLGTYVDSLTWRADLLKMMGRYAEARDAIARALSELPFTNHSQRAFALWKSAEIEMLAGADEESVPSALSEALELAARSGSSRTQFWILVTAADAARPSDHAKARDFLSKARGLEGSVGTFGRIFWLLQNAELEKEEGNLRQSRASARRAWWLATFRYSMPSASLSAVMLQCQLSVLEKGRADSLSQWRMGRVRRRFARLGMKSLGARAEVLSAIFQGAAISQDRVQHFSNEGWAREAARAGGDAQSAWHVIM